MTDCERPPNYHGDLPGCRDPPHYSNSIHHTDEVDDRSKYRFEAERRRSFANWPLSFIHPHKLAAAGFYYTNEDDKVRCFECRIEICRWDEGDDPKYEHQRWSECCRFIRKIPCGNVPIGMDPADVPPPAPRTRDVCGLYGIDTRNDSTTEYHDETQPPSFQQISAAALGSLGLGRPTGPLHPEYASYDARLNTFKMWPKSMKQTKEELADAGFYYTGQGDQTMCYHCGGGLKDWEPNDDPWEQHAAWFSKCCYLLTVKGQEFVDRVRGVDIPPLSTEETMLLNLPNCIRKVGCGNESNPKDEMSQVESEPGPSCSQGSRDLRACKVQTTCQEINLKGAESGYGSRETLSNDKPQDDKRADEKPLDDGRLCKICYTEELGVVFLPCGHMVACVKCAPSLTICAVCRQPFTMTVRAFIS